MNAQEIISEIDNYLDKALLKKSKITNEELIEYIEEKWAQADDEKYNLYFSQIICGRMINEYVAKKDVEHVRRWLDIYERHENSKKHPSYIHKYFRGQSFLKCNAEEEEVFEYLKLCYEENPEYIFTGDKECINLFCKRTGIKLPEEKSKGKKEYFTGHALSEKFPTRI